VTETRSSNNFDFLRIIAALMVLIYHSYALLQLGDRDPLHCVTGAMNFGTLGVSIFFVISGFLITKSWLSHPSVVRFYWNRFLRIVPGLLGVALFTVFIVGPIMTSLPLMEYWMSNETWNYFRVVTIIGIFPHTPNLPGVFAFNPYPNAVNGSLWTLPVEFSMYVVVSILGLLKLLTRKNSLLVGTVVFAIVYIIFTQMNVLSPIYTSILGYQLFFLIGSLYYLFNNEIAYNHKYLLVISAIWIASFQTAVFNLASLLCLPYMILCFAHVSIPYICNISKYGDFSYGVYIYAFLIQQTLIDIFESMSPLKLVLLSSIGTLMCAALSWIVIESKALKLKKINILNELKHLEATWHRTLFKRS
jgi:peptidoglycan/LPS O-acetylase OafA/YrhL